MTKRERLRVEKPKQSYFVSDKPDISFVSSGCTLLDCALGGGYPLGRMVNIVGDKSTAKTALATEAMINFKLGYPEGAAAYRETEAAFDRSYSAAMGLPVDQIDFGDDNPMATVEDFDRDLETFIDDQTSADNPGIYVVDSVDALSDEAEMERDISKGSFGAAKAKQLSVLFRTRTKKIESSKVLLFIVSQVRENIGAMFGEKYKRSGGKSLDFYASQIVWLAHIKTHKRTIKGVERAVGVRIKANVKKNKVGLAFRKVEFDFMFGYGVDDLKASVEWLKEVKRLDAIDMNEAQVKSYLTKIDTMDNKEYNEERTVTAEVVRKVWAEIETSFLPTRSKYG